MRTFRNKKNHKEIYHLSKCEEKNKIKNFEENQDFEELFKLED